MAYPFNYSDALVIAGDRICMHCNKINISKSLAGQGVAIEAVDGGV